MSKATFGMALGVGISVVGAASAETLTVSNGLPPTHVVSIQGFEPWMACIKEGTQGEVDFNYFPSGQIASVSESLDALSSGLADVAFVSPSNEGSRMPLNGIAMLPGMGQTSVEMVANYRRVLDAPGPIAEELSNNKIRALAVNVLPAYQIMSADEPIDTLEKFQGRSVRAAGSSLSFTVSALGAAPVEMPAGDMYMSMQRGTVDSTILALSSIKTYSMQELLKAISTNGSFGTSAQMFAISDAAWERLTPEQQAVATECGRKTEQSMSAYIDSQDEILREEFAAAGITMFEFTPEELSKISERLATVSNDYIARLEARGLPAQEAYDQYRAVVGQ